MNASGGKVETKQDGRRDLDPSGGREVVCRLRRHAALSIACLKGPAQAAARTKYTPITCEDVLLEHRAAELQVPLTADAVNILLIGQAFSFTLGPIALDTLLKHYFDRVKKEKARHDPPFTQLRQDELLYDEAFSIIKRFLDVATQHSVEDLQAFSNTRTPSPPWVHVVRVTVPMSCCDEAATLLIRALGGEEHTSHTVGGTKWWQVRGVTGVGAEWVTARKDWEEAKKRQKTPHKKKTGSNISSQDPPDFLPPSTSDPTSIYDDSENWRCILYIHGGGYYFGSVDQERYSIQRLSRKIKGRVFAVNYRLAPQYPFPCAIQDLVAAYLYLVDPPPDAPHRPVKPSHIVVAGDSAGGGLTLALLQVLRDSGQALPAGGVLISPWCDLTHSFPSVHTNTATDVLPFYGLSLHKPSALWPPPSDEMTHKIHTGIRQKIRQIVRVAVSGPGAGEVASLELTQDALASGDIPIDVGATTPLPSVGGKEDQTISVITKSGEQLEVKSQVQLYTQNSLLGHPLVSPALSYLGGLPPLFIIASDKEVLRDEIIYSAHRAADPSKFPLKEEARALYPSLVGIEERYKHTLVHLQVYDDTAHVLPVLFPFSTPGKFCYRAIATFTKHVTGMLDQTNHTPSSSEIVSTPQFLVSSPTSSDFPGTTPIFSPLSSDLVSESQGALAGSRSAPNTRARTQHTFNLRPSFSLPTFLAFTKSEPITGSTSDQPLRRSDTGVLRLRDSFGVRNTSKWRRSVSVMESNTVRHAGEASVYYDEEGVPTWTEGMIRERVNTQGVIRPLEENIDALHIPSAVVGAFSEKAVHRYLEGKAHFDRKFAKEFSAIEKHRNRNIDLAKKDSTKNLNQLQELQNGRTRGKQKGTSQTFKDGLELSSGAWGWAWADERPPPSSIVSRRDTAESRRLARIADQSVLQEEVSISGNNLWAVIMNFLTTSPPKEQLVADSEAAEPVVEHVATKSKSAFAPFRIREK